MSGVAVEQRLNLHELTTRQLLDWLYVTMARDAAGGVAWHEVRDAVDKSLRRIADSLQRESGRLPEGLDPETWGTLPEQQAGMMAAMRMAGG